MEWQANGVAPHILMPTKIAKVKITELIKKYQITFDETDGYRIEEMISELADFYGFIKTSCQDAYSRNGLFKSGWGSYIR